MTQTTLSALKSRATDNVDTTHMNMDTVQGFEALQRAAKLFASSDIVPQRYQGNVANTFIALDVAMRIGVPGLQALQHLYVVHGNPSWSSQFLIACFNKSGRFSALRYEFSGQQDADSWGCRAWAVEKDTGERLEGAVVTIGLAKKEGWHGKSGSKWQTMPQQMLMYRAASWFVRAFAPEIAMGLHTAEEIQDVYDMAQSPNGHYEMSSGEIAAQQQSVPEDPAPADAENSAGEGFADPFGGGQFVTCPNNGKQVDDTDCAAKPCRDGCPAFA